jgi:threonylcarbamoyladenosine tRNA methylthiotransferase MtaB
MLRRPLAAVLTLGCKLNLADSDEIASGLRHAGFDVVDHLCEADAVVLNTCSVTHVADQKSRRLVRSARRLAPGGLVAVTGCFPRSAGSEAARQLGADLVAGVRRQDREALVALIAGAHRGGSDPPPACQSSTSGQGIHTRAFIAAQAGCNDVCAFCIVPRTRGREQSRAASEVAADVNRVAESGVREAVITGTQLGAWGRDLDPPLAPHHLIAALLEQTELPRIRFSSLQPQDITPELLGLWTDPRLAPHFHLALQSGSDRVLAAMRRRYSSRDYRLALERIRAAVPAVAVTTDVIAGFPGESGSDFEDTLALCEEAAFARLHCFPYSARAHTAAARMPGQVAEPVRRERLQRLLALGERLALRFRERNLGSVRPVLWEAERPGPDGPRWRGYTDNYLAVYASGDGLANRITPALLSRLYHDGIEGVLPGAEP